MKKNKILIAIFLAAFIILGSCKESFFDIKPKGSLGEDVLATEKGVNTLLIGAYSLLDGVSAQFGWEAASSNWVYGDIRGMIGNKGTDAGDQPDINPIQTFTETATNPYLNVKWRSDYEAINRCNNTIKVAAKALENGAITQEQHDLFVKQARALRGWYHFEAWRLWGGMIPYIDETTDLSALTNTADVTAQILADLEAGTTLPNNMSDVGRFNGTVCNVLLAKAKMQMKHDYAGALANLRTAKSGTKPNGAAIGLATTYGEIFDIENRNGIESVYTVQYSVNDGSGGNNGGNGEVLNFPYKGGASPGGCCGFYQGTQEFVNSFRTDANGLPLLDFSYNNDPVVNDFGLKPSDPFTPDAGNLDPRLDWSIGRRSIPYWDWGPMTGSDWVRDQTYAGCYAPKKQVYAKSQEGVWTEVGNWTSGWTANGYRMIRFADVLLLEAECMIETGDLAGALANINAVRTRAMNPDGFVKNPDGTPAANYVIGTYASFPNKDFATKALQMERKLELGMEGHRYFDLNRWGITVTELNRVLSYEKTTPWGSGSMYKGASIGPEDVSFPIPQRQIDLSNGLLVQNR